MTGASAGPEARSRGSWWIAEGRRRFRAVFRARVACGGRDADGIWKRRFLGRCLARVFCARLIRLAIWGSIERVKDGMEAN